MLLAYVFIWVIDVAAVGGAAVQVNAFCQILKMPVDGADVQVTECHKVSKIPRIEQIECIGVSVALGAENV